MWEIFSPVQSWSRRHKKIVQVAAVIAGATGGYVLYKKLSPIVTDMVASYKLLRQMEKDLEVESKKQDDERIYRHFKQTHDAARLALGHLSIELRDQFEKYFAVHTLKERLRHKSDEGSRAESRLNEFKVAVVSRTLSMLYSLCLCCVVLRLQLCIAARYASNANSNPRQHQINAEFLRIIQFFNMEGAENLAKIVTATVANRTVMMTMQTIVDRGTFDKLLDEILAELDQELMSDCSRFFLPTLDGLQGDRIFLQMRSELAQLLSSRSISIVMKAGRQVARESLHPIYEIFTGEGTPPAVIFGRSLPKFALVFEKTIPTNVSEAQSSIFLDSLCCVPELDDFGSIVFFPIGQNDVQRPIALAENPRLNAARSNV